MCPTSKLTFLVDNVKIFFWLVHEVLWRTVLFSHLLFKMLILYSGGLMTSDLFNKVFGKWRTLYPSTLTPKLLEELHGCCAGGSGMWAKGVYGCVWEQLEWTVITFACKIVVLFPWDKNKHCNWVEGAACCNCINLNGICGLKEHKCKFHSS